MELSPDLRDLLEAFANEAVEYLIVGGYAVSLHSRPRFTKDLDIWLGTRSDNVARAGKALEAFGAPPQIREALGNARPDEIVYLGSPPLRVDLLKTLPGLDDFDEAYARRVTARWGELDVSLIGLGDLIASKRAAGRPQDLLDVEVLERARKRPGA